jgi:hypothetical protein
MLLVAQRGKSKRWLPGKLRTQTSFALPAPEPAEDEQNKHAAAAEVVRLTGSQAQQPSRHEQDAVAIQSAYRGYLVRPRPSVASSVKTCRVVGWQTNGFQARRALRARKGLVRLQALIRGQAVRRQTAATLRGLESLMKIQARHRGGGPPHPDDLLLMRRELYAAAVHVSLCLPPTTP